MTRRSFIVGLAAVAQSSGAWGGIPVSRTSSKITLSATVNLGTEAGQPLGTIFQIRGKNQTGVVAALGVPQFYNHYVRNNPRMLHSFAKKGDQSAFTVTELGASRDDNPRYHTFVLDGVLIDGTNRQYYDEGSDAWLNLPSPWNGATLAASEQINYAHRIGGSVFISTDKGVFYDGARIIDGTSNASYKTSLGTVLYYDGLLFTEFADGLLRVYEWTPGNSVGVPISTYALISGHFLRAFGILNGAVYAVSGKGRLLRYDRAGNIWSYVSQPESVGEFYCLMQVGGGLRLGDFPNGDQWQIGPSSTLTRLRDFPPEEDGAGPDNREIQAMATYGGDMIIPLFPWGAIHRRDEVNSVWHDQRLYSTPAIDTSDGPYRATMSGDWRQRLSCAGIWKDSIFVSASNTPGDLHETDYASIPNRSEYGTVWKMTRPHAVSGELDWKTGPTTFTMEISASGIVTKQDGNTISTVAGFSPSQMEGSDPLTVEFGNGLYGAFPGTVVNTSVLQE